MRISDWSSDVCSSDLGHAQETRLQMQWRGLTWRRQASCSSMAAGATATVQRSTASIRRPAIRCGKAVPPIAKTYTMHSRLRGARSTTGAIADRKSVVEGTGVAVSVDTGGRGIIKKQTKINIKKK